MPTKYAVFDVDGTVIAKDSFIYILKFAYKRQPWRLLVTLTIGLLFALISLVFFDKLYIKSFLLWSITVGKSKRDIVKFFSSTQLINELSTLWFREANAELDKLRSQNIKILYCSASGQIWLRHLLKNCDKGEKSIIGTKLGFFCFGIIITSKNCYNKEKIKRIYDFLGDSFSWEYSYTDHVADIPILSKAKNKYIISPKNKHLMAFSQILGNNSFTVLNWNKNTEKKTNE